MEKCFKEKIEPLHVPLCSGSCRIIYFSPPSIVKWWPNMPSMAGERIRMS